MARRSKHPKTAPEPIFDQAFGRISTLEAACCYRAVTPDFDLNDVVEWLFDDHTRDVLRAAKSLVKPHHSPYFTATLSLPGLPTQVCLTINTSPTRLACPTVEALCIQHTSRKAAAIMECMREVMDVHAQWQNVREVVQWLNENATPSAARYYFPSIASLMPESHPIHRVSGVTFREPKRPVSGEISDRMRRAMTTVAMGLLSEGPPTREIEGYVTVNVLHDGGESQTFRLL